MPRRLVLFFDGTGQVFQGNRSDTNVVKLYRRMNREDADQFLYYQPGIGTYSNNEYSGLFRWAFEKREKVRELVDQAFATTFKSHVIAGYQFIMKYWEQGSEIYIFGFSRGSYTARFLAQMITDVGLLTQGNEEMVNFAWSAFSQYMQHLEDRDETRKQKAGYMHALRNTYSRDNCSIHFLGLFDCVNSVEEFELPFGKKQYRSIPTLPATHIRHAVSIHERRLKFKPALFASDLNSEQASDRFGNWREHHTVKEVWFAGNHGDIGGGYAPLPGQRALLSDITLDWMIHEVGTHKGESVVSSAADGPKFLSTEQLLKKEVFTSDDFVARGDDKAANDVDPESFLLHDLPGKAQKSVRNHDTLALGQPRGSSFFSWLLWWLVESLPFFSRLELEEGHWVPRSWPPNLGAMRDIPHPDDVSSIHGSVSKLGALGVFDVKKFKEQLAQGRSRGEHDIV